MNNFDICKQSHKESEREKETGFFMVDITVCGVCALNIHHKETCVYIGT